MLPVRTPARKQLRRDEERQRREGAKSAQRQSVHKVYLTNFIAAQVHTARGAHKAHL